MAANTKYAFRAQIFMTSPGAADFDWRHVGPASPTLVRIFRKHFADGDTVIGHALDIAYSAADILLAGPTMNGWIEMDGIIQNGANAGDFEFHWAQNVSNAGNTTVFAGSYLEWAQF